MLLPPMSPVSLPHAQDWLFGRHFSSLVTWAIFFSFWHVFFWTSAAKNLFLALQVASIKTYSDFFKPFTPVKLLCALIHPLSQGHWVPIKSSFPRTWRPEDSPLPDTGHWSYRPSILRGAAWSLLGSGNHRAANLDSSTYALPWLFVWVVIWIILEISSSQTGCMFFICKDPFQCFLTSFLYREKNLLSVLSP